MLLCTELPNQIVYSSQALKIIKKENFCFIYRKIEFLTFFFTFLQEKANEFERHLDTFVKRLDNGTLS